MVKNRHGELSLAKEDMWFMEASYQQIVKEAIRLTAITETIYFKNKPREVSIEFVLKVIKLMMSEKMGELNTEIVKIGKRYYVEITGDNAFKKQPLVPFKGFYKWLKANGIHTGKDPNAITPGDLYAIANERKIKRNHGGKL
jgi:hypothetical protein